MVRVLSFAVLAVLAACSSGADEAGRLRAGLGEARAEASELGRDLGRARARIRSLEREARRPPPPPDPARFVDLWHGGPTMRGPLLALPRLGVIRWSCNFDDRFRIVYENAGASTHVALETSRDQRRGMAHSNARIVATIHDGETVTWRITHRHPPGFVRAHIVVTAAESKHGNCVLPKVELHEVGRLYD